MPHESDFSHFLSGMRNDTGDVSVASLRYSSCIFFSLSVPDSYFGGYIPFESGQISLCASDRKVAFAGLCDVICNSMDTHFNFNIKEKKNGKQFYAEHFRKF